MPEENSDGLALPREIITVHAIDRDKDPSSREIIYKLEGQGAGNFFTINDRTGQVFVQKPLDRDQPNGAPEWNLVVQAIDDGGKGLAGYADLVVRLTDINDNGMHM